jgi:hypothetical protein
VLAYKTLSQTHPDYQPKLIQELSDLYEGGYAILSRAKDYLPKLVGETDLRYQERLKIASYISYFGQIVDSYTSQLGTREVSVLPASDAEDDQTPGEMPDDLDGFWHEFSRDSDLRETPFSRMVLDICRTALIHRRGLLAVDFPAVGDVPVASLADEQAEGRTRAYVFQVDPTELIDWEYDTQIRRSLVLDGDYGKVDFELGKFAWVVLRRTYTRRSSVTASRGLITEEFKVWQRDPETGVVSWQLYAIEYEPNRPPKPDDIVPLVGEGITTFPEIPILEFCVPNGLWIGNKIGPLAKEHYQRRSALLAAENKSLVAIPYVKLGPEVPEVDGAVSETQSDPNRGKDPRARFNGLGYIAIGKDDDIGFASPDPAAYELVDRELDALVDEMHRVVSMMATSVSSTSKALDRSGLSKQEDNRAMTIILGAYGSLVREFAVRVYCLISASRGEDVVWTPHGADRYDVYDRAQILQEALQIGKLSIPSATWRREYAIQTALRLTPNLPVETQALVRSEIVTGISDQQTMPPDTQDPPPPPGGDDEGSYGTEETPASSPKPGAQQGSGVRLPRASRR